MQAPLPIVSPTTEQPRMSLYPSRFQRLQLISSRYESDAPDEGGNRRSPSSRDHFEGRLCDIGTGPEMVQSFSYVCL
jgi:hypothetical protein